MMARDPWLQGNHVRTMFKGIERLLRATTMLTYYVMRQYK